MIGFHSICNKLLHGIFLILFFCSVFLYKERLFADAAYYFFHAINSGWFHIEHGRTVLGLSQWLPILGTYFHLPLKLVVILASVGHEIYYYGLFLLCLYGLKDRASAIAILGIHVVGQLWLYYSPMLEICYGAALAVVFYSILHTGKYKDGKWLLLLFLSQWFAMMSHPENFLLIAVAIAYHYLNAGYQSIQLKSSAILVVAFVIEILTFSSYEKGHADLTNGNLSASVMNLTNLNYLSNVIGVFTSYYLDLLLLFFATASYMILTKKWKILFVFIGSILFLIAIVNQVANANQFTRYYESMYNPLVFIVILFFCHEILNSNYRWLKISGVIALFIVIFVRIFWIVEFGKPLRQRMAQLERIVDYSQNLGHSKYIINGFNYERDYSSYTWSVPIESLILSAMDEKSMTITLAAEYDLQFGNNKKLVNDSTYMFRMFEVEPHTFLNTQYFDLKRGSYHHLNSAFDGRVFKDKIVLEPDKWNEVNKNDTLYLPLLITNLAEQKIPSNAENPILLSYHWLKEDGGVLEWDGLRTPIEVDVFDRYVQDIKIATPKFKGNYLFVPDLVIEGEMWFDLKKSFKVEVN